MKKKILTVAVILTCATATLQSAVVVLDQDHFPPTQPLTGAALTFGTFGRSQTFTVGIAGILDSVEVDVILGPPSTMRILQTSGGVPIGGSAASVVLASSTSVSTTVPGIYRFDLSGSNLPVAIGDVLAIELFAPGNWRGDSTTGGTSYLAGNDFFFDSNIGINDWSKNLELDNRFRTYVIVPEPTAMLFLLVSGFFVALTKRR